MLMCSFRSPPAKSFMGRNVFVFCLICLELSVSHRYLCWNSKVHDMTSCWCKCAMPGFFYCFFLLFYFSSTSNSNIYDCSLCSGSFVMPSFCGCDSTSVLVYLNHHPNQSQVVLFPAVVHTRTPQAPCPLAHRWGAELELESETSWKSCCAYARVCQ